MMEHDRLNVLGAPVVVENLHIVLGGDRAHARGPFNAGGDNGHARSRAWMVPPAGTTQSVARACGRGMGQGGHATEPSLNRACVFGAARPEPRGGRLAATAGIPWL